MPYKSGNTARSGKRDTNPVPDNIRRRGLHRYFLPLQHFLYPPERDLGEPGYGMDFQQRYPSFSNGSLRKIKRQREENAALMLVALITGIATGAAASLLKFSIASLSQGLTSFFDAGNLNWWLIFLPLCGILLTGIYQRYVIHREIYHGVGRLSYDFSHNRCYLPVSLTYSPLIAATVTLGFGGSAGSEGPIAYSGAALGSNISSFLRMSPRTVRAMTAIGAGAGIAGIFKAPAGGALFTIEVLGIGMSAVSVAALVVACVASALTAYLMSGCSPDIPFHHASAISLDFFPMILLFGVLCGLYSTYYSKIMEMMRSYFRSIVNPWIRNSIAGLTCGLLVFLFPPLYGEGYGIVAKLLDGEYGELASGGVTALLPSIACEGANAVILLAAAGILAVKSFATTSANSGGGVAGDFAPTIMAGSVFGLLYAGLVNNLGGITLPIPDYVFMGMAGILAGAIRAPLMAMFLITEMATMGYGQFMPVAIVATVSYLTVCLFNFVSNRILPRRKNLPGGKGHR